MMNKEDSASLKLTINLASGSADAFRLALRELNRIAGERPEEAAALVTQAAADMSAQGIFSLGVQASRLRTILESVKLNTSGMEVLIDRSRTLSSVLINEVSAYLSPNQRRRLRSQNVEAMSRDSYASDLVTLPGTDRRSEGIPYSSEYSIPTAEDLDDCSVVLLLSKLTSPANVTLLKDRRFHATHIDSVEKLKADVSTLSDVCACIIDGSFLQGTDANAQKSIFDIVASYSTFIWIRVDETSLSLTQRELSEHIQAARHDRTPVLAESLSIQPGGTLREFELNNIAGARKRLRSQHGTKLIFDDISNDKARVLLAAIRQYAHNRGTRFNEASDSMRVKFIRTGKSGADVVVVKIGSTDRRIVAKIHDKDPILSEMGRFREFVQSSDDKLHPMVYFHGSVGVIVFDLVAEPDDPDRPAPMLEECMEGIWNDELFPPPTHNSALQVDNIKRALKGAAEQLSKLNRTPAPKSSYPSYGDLFISKFRDLEVLGLNWNLSILALTARDTAEKRYETLRERATVHGDLHLRNILIRGDREAHLIDYAGSGPGHPAIDLVRLELALYLDFFRQVDDVNVCNDLQKKISTGAAYNAVKEWYPTLLRPSVNDVCIYGCIAARERALVVLRFYGGNEEDYYAVKYLVAWQRLLQPRTQTALVRGIIETLAPLVRVWSEMNAPGETVSLGLGSVGA